MRAPAAGRARLVLRLGVGALVLLVSASLLGIVAGDVDWAIASRCWTSSSTRCARGEPAAHHLDARRHDLHSTTAVSLYGTVVAAWMEVATLASLVTVLELRGRRAWHGTC